jgi:hypothetical protein
MAKEKCKALEPKRAVGGGGGSPSGLKTPEKAPPDGISPELRVA